MHESLNHIDKAIRATAATATTVFWDGSNLRIE